MHRFAFLFALLLLFGCSDGPRSSPKASSSRPSEANASRETLSQIREPVYALHLDSAGRVWAGTDRGVLRRDTAKGRWTRVHVSGVHDGGGADTGERVYSMIRHLAEGPEGAMYAGHHRLYRSADGGATWEAIDRRLQKGGGMGDVATLATVDSLVFAGFVSAGLWRSASDGRLWTRVLGTDDAHVSAVAGAPDGQVFAVTLPAHGEGAHLHRSTDGGRTWTDIGTVPVSLTSLAADSTGTLFGAGIRKGGVGLAAVRSDDNGATWSKIDDLKRVLTIHRDPTGRLMGLGMTGVFLRTPDGWVRTASTSTQVHAAGVASDASVWIGTRSGLKTVPVRTP